jgi:tripartite-type tricarboxylate transporter receptor subunit TctC
MNAGGLMAPSGIPEPILKKLEQAVQDAGKDPGFIKTMEKISWTPQARTAKEFTQDVNTALTTFRDLLGELDLLKKKD